MISTSFPFLLKYIQNHTSWLYSVLFLYIYPSLPCWLPCLRFYFVISFYFVSYSCRCSFFLSLCHAFESRDNEQRKHGDWWRQSWHQVWVSSKRWKNLYMGLKKLGLPSSLCYHAVMSETYICIHSVNYLSWPTPRVLVTQKDPKIYKTKSYHQFGIVRYYFI